MSGSHYIHADMPYLIHRPVIQISPGFSSIRLIMSNLFKLDLLALDLTASGCKQVGPTVINLRPEGH